MEEGHLRVLLGNVEGRVQVAKAGRKDDRRALLDHLLHDALCLCRLWDVLGVDRLHVGHLADS